MADHHQRHPQRTSLAPRRKPVASTPTIHPPARATPRAPQDLRRAHHRMQVSSDAAAAAAAAQAQANAQMPISSQLADRVAPQAPYHAYRVTYPVPEPTPAPPKPHRRRLVPWSPFWHWAKIFVRSFASICAFVGIILACISGSSGQATGLPPLFVSLFYDAAEYYIVFRNFRSRRSMNPWITVPAETFLIVLLIICASLFMKFGVRWVDSTVFDNGRRAAFTSFLFVAIIIRFALLVRASIELHQRRTVGEVCQYFYDPSTSEPPMRVMITDLYGFDPPDKEITEPRPEFWDDEEQGSTDKVYIPEELRR